MSNNSSKFGATKIHNRLTALWAFNEAAFGGMLHALHIPFTGLFVGGFAVLIIGLILRYSQSKRDLLKSATIVIAVKFLISPYTPLNAYVSVLFQTFSAYILFGKGKSFGLFAYSFSVITLLFSAFQRVVVYTILFGYTLWESIDSFYFFLLNELGAENTSLTEVSLSKLIIVAYAFLHLFGGIVAGNILSRLPKLIQERKSEISGSDILNEIKTEADKTATGKKKKRNFLKRISVLAILIVAFVLLAISFFAPEKISVTGGEIILMIIRFVAIMLLWYFLAIPFLHAKLRNYAEQTKRKYAGDIKNIFEQFSLIRKLIAWSWKNGKQKKVFARVKYFFSTLLTLFLFYDET